MRQATAGDTVRVHYTGALADGTEFDSSAERGPIEVTIGSGQVIPGFDDALLGMAEGETKSVTLEAKDAYGEHNPQLVHVVERARIPAEIDLSIGTVVQASDASGNRIPLLVLELDDDSVTFDANHPLAGKALTYELKLIEFVG